MITRITRGTVLPNNEGLVFAAMRAAIEGRGEVPGLVDVSISRKVTDGRIVMVGIATWTDIGSMAAVLGPNWHEPIWLPGLEGAIVDASVEIFETVASSIDELAELPVAV